MLSQTLKSIEGENFQNDDLDIVKASFANQSIEDLARTYFFSYIGYMYPNYQFSSHNVAIATALQAVADGRIERLIINMPPRHGKTMQTCELFPSFFMGQNPNLDVISAAYGADLAQDSGRKVRNYMASEDYTQLFPAAQLSLDSKGSKKFNTMEGGTYVAAGIGGPIVGRGASLFIIDDPFKSRKDANSETKRAEVKSWYKGVVYTRLAPGARIVVIMTRWHDDDLTGYLLDKHDENWYQLSLPAIAEEDETEFIQRKQGEALWPDRFPIERLLKIREVIQTLEFNSQYQQKPIATEDATFNMKHFNRFKHSEVSDFLASVRMKLDPPEQYKMPLGIKRVVLSCDTSFKEGKENSPSCLQAWGETDEGYKIIYRYSKKVKYYRIKKVIKNIWKQWSGYVNVVVLIEDRASGQSLIQDLENDKDCKNMVIIKYYPKVDKLTRAQQAAAVVEAGKVWLPDQVYWLPGFETTIMNYPASKFVDDVDSMSQFLIWVSRKRFKKGKLKKWKRR